MRRIMRFGLLTAGFALFPLSQGLAQVCQSYWTAQYKCMQGCGPCTGGGNGYVAPQQSPYVAPGPSPAQIAARRATELNNEGIEAEKANDWARAVSLLEQASRTNPDDATIANNLRMARATALNNDGVKAHNAGDFARAESLYEQALQLVPNYVMAAANLKDARASLRAEREDRIAVANVQQDVKNLVHSLSAVPTSGGLDFNDGKPSSDAVKFCATQLRVAADQRAIEQMNFGNDARSFEMFADVSATQKAKFQEKALDALLDQGLKATTIAAESASSLNPYNVNTTINKLRAKGFNNDAIFAGLRKIAATKGKPAMAEAYKDFVDIVQKAKEGYDTGKEMAEESQNANLRLLLGVLKVAQGNPEAGLAVTAADFGESFFYLGYISAQVGDLTQVTDDKLVLLKGRIDRLKQDVSALNAAKQDWATTSQKPGEPDCHT